MDVKKGSVQVIQVRDYEEMSTEAAKIIAAEIMMNPRVVLGLATGSTPVGIYQKLIDCHKDGKLDFSGVTTVNLDEYCGLAPDNEQSYRYFMDKNLFDHINVKGDNIHIPSGMASDHEMECKRYDELIEQLGGIDFQLLGIGHNGHIGFNEPGAAFNKGSHCVALQPMTIEANARFFDSPDDVPKHALTMGMKSIMQAGKVLLVSGSEDKREIIDRALNGPITPEVPASILQLHPHVVVIMV